MFTQVKMEMSLSATAQISWHPGLPVVLTSQKSDLCFHREVDIEQQTIHRKKSWKQQRKLDILFHQTYHDGTKNSLHWSLYPLQGRKPTSNNGRRAEIHCGS